MRAALVVVDVVVETGNVNKRRLAGEGVLELENDAVVSTNTESVVLLALFDTFEPLTNTGAGVVLVMRAAVLVDADVGAGVVVVVDVVVGAGVVVLVVEFVHVLDPAAAEYEPTGQLSHTELPLEGLYVPAGHSSQRSTGQTPSIPTTMTSLIINILSGWEMCRYRPVSGVGHVTL